MNQWQIGSVTITRVVEMQVAGGTRFILPDATRELCRPIEWMHPHFMDDDGNLIMSIHGLVVDTGTRRILVDTCVGNDKERSVPNWTNLQTTFLQDLAAAGYPRESIDTVLCTHLHVDHVGWNTMLVDGKWEPTFTNARYLIAEEEWTHWDSVDGDDFGPVIEDSVRPVIAAGLVDLVTTNHRVCDEVWLEPTPGHTPGHVSVHVQSEGQSALITGDCIHHPVQMTKTDWCSSADFDQKQGQDTRELLLRRYVDKDTLVIGTHFATPTAGYVKALADGGYWLQTEAFNP
ncbi:MAG TPA: MBL fold metallo-hydrolase [Gammaproteobacteria bacterium]|nr:MBL fold metallo-hydrolase [Gammaproteobacteria bacterium]|tara:strand:- start:5096 stop:5962 length:867 start_codon:yes stop_codon:yes gene_type:complete